MNSTEIKPVQWLQGIVQDGQPDNAYPHGDLHFDVVRINNTCNISETMQRQMLISFFLPNLVPTRTNGTPGAKCWSSGIH